MDTSNSDLQFVLRGEVPRKVKHDALTSRQWLELVRELMGMQKAYKKYMPVLRHHRDAVSEICDVSGTRSTFDRTEPEHIFYKPLASQPSLSADTRLLPLIPLYPWKANHLRDYSDTEWTKGVLKEDYLLYGLGWVRLRRLLTKTEVAPLSFTVRVRFYAFFELDENGLVAAIGDRPVRWCMLYDAFQALMLKAVHTKRRHMEQMERCYKAGAEPRGRISVPSSTF